MHRLGGSVVSSPDASSTSATKGETVADTVRVVEHYADILVLRHSSDGAARVASNFSKAPVINAGDGSHEHPSQTLCDLYTLYREKKSINNLTVYISGDLKNGRTVHSLVYGLALFGAHILFGPAQGLELPQHVQLRLSEEFPGGQVGIPATHGHAQAADLPIDVVYQTPSGAHQLALLPGVSGQIDIRQQLDQIDVFYMTRFQRERSPAGSQTTYPVVDRAFLNKPKFKGTSVLHPLPRVDELGYDLDSDPRGAYFRQAAYGVPVRMALLAGLLGIEKVLDAEPPAAKYRVYSQSLGIRCGNDRCITNSDSERRHLKCQFELLGRRQMTLRCVYCDHEVVPAVVGNKKTKAYDFLSTALGQPKNLESVVFFKDENEARAAGFERGHVAMGATQRSSTAGRV
jgi:aspartate carbamoyltransferase catalytic subunit